MTAVAVHDRRDWIKKAACRDLPPDTADRLFFPDKRPATDEMMRYCGPCPVRLDCLAAGENEVGVWGGILNPPTG